ncbi:pyridoxamine 5'-phosphate oxidase family protein [Kitasatospora sp. NPDC101157]|uniref:pyridoxamine 5'-phosphate oxidase family protein n=1 Tax=Kitasatospora sp. NPDC101157 TaxID=3364098 RepID=UPI0037F7D086
MRTTEDPTEHGQTSQASEGVATGAPTGLSPRSAELSRGEAWELLGSISYGRVVFSQSALPAIRPVNHVLADDCVIIRTNRGAALLSPAQDGAVLAYEADVLDPLTRSGWSVIVTGIATLVTDPEEQHRYSELLQPWIGGHMEHVVRISADLVTGYRIG